MDRVPRRRLGYGFVVFELHAGYFSDSTCVRAFRVLDLLFDKIFFDICMDKYVLRLQIIPSGVYGDELAEGEFECSYLF